MGSRFQVGYLCCCNCEDWAFGVGLYLSHMEVTCHFVGLLRVNIYSLIGVGVCGLGGGT